MDDLVVPPVVTTGTPLSVAPTLPVLQAPSPPVPLSMAFRPILHKMGGLVQVSHSDWCTWTGGKPKADCSGLDTSAAQYPNDDFQYRPTSPGSSQKSTSHREKGMDIKFKRDGHLLDFLDIVDSYLRRTGMDSISYLVDPTNPIGTASVVQQYSKFELQEGISKSRDGVYVRPNMTDMIVTMTIRHETGYSIRLTKDSRRIWLTIYTQMMDS
jgi:hypothetical protein